MQEGAQFHAGQLLRFVMRRNPAAWRDIDRADAAALRVPHPVAVLVDQYVHRPAIGGQDRVSVPVDEVLAQGHPVAESLAVGVGEHR
jgi:hypothetical protein